MLHTWDAMVRHSLIILKHNHTDICRTVTNDFRQEVTSVIKGITKHDFLKEMREAFLRKMILKLKKKEELVDKKSAVLISGKSICKGPVAREIMDIRPLFSLCGQKSP